MVTSTGFRSLTNITSLSSMVTKPRRVAGRCAVISYLLGAILVSTSPPTVCSCGSWIPHPHSPVTLHSHSHAAVLGAAKWAVFWQDGSAVSVVHAATGEVTKAAGHASLPRSTAFLSPRTGFWKLDSGRLQTKRTVRNSSLTCLLAECWSRS